VKSSTSSAVVIAMPSANQLLIDDGFDEITSALLNKLDA
jgi:hypothetical protein